MKECKIIHINDGNPQEITNGNFLFVEEYVFASEIVNQYLGEGWEVRNMIPVFTPNMRDSSPAFFRSGFTFYLERIGINE